MTSALIGSGVERSVAVRRLLEPDSGAEHTCEGAGPLLHRLDPADLLGRRWRGQQVGQTEGGDGQDDDGRDPPGDQGDQDPGGQGGGQGDARPRGEGGQPRPQRGGGSLGARLGFVGLQRV